MKKHIYPQITKTLVVFALVNTSISLGQVVNNVDNSPSYELANNSDMAFMSLRIVSGGDDGPDGSYYLDEAFSPGTILFHKTKQKIVTPIRFNAADNEIEIQKNGNVMALTPIDGMEVRSNYQVFVAVKNPQNAKYIFAESLITGTNKLYDFFEVKVDKAPSDATLLNLEQKDKISIRPNLYFQINEGVIKPLPKRKKEINEAFDAEALAILKKEKLNLKKKEDAIKFFNLLNTQ